jgi:hypothetical protein
VERPIQLDGFWSQEVRPDENPSLPLPFVSAVNVLSGENLFNPAGRRAVGKLLDEQLMEAAASIADRVAKCSCQTSIVGVRKEGWSHRLGFNAHVIQEDQCEGLRDFRPRHRTLFGRVPLLPIDDLAILIPSAFNSVEFGIVATNELKEESPV